VAAAKSGDWLSDHSTLLVGVVGIVFSGFVGPTVTGLLTGRRERARDGRLREAAHREDLRELADDAARLLAVGATNLRLMREAKNSGQEPSPELMEWSRSVFPLGQRLRLRLPEGHRVVKQFDEVRARLAKAGDAGNDDEITTTVEEFEAARSAFLEAAREAVQAPISEKDIS
jgi:hypothetical protein